MARLSRQRAAVRATILKSAMSGESKKVSTGCKHPVEATVESKFKTMLKRLGPDLASCYHVGLDRLEFDYEVSNTCIGSGCSGDVLLAQSKHDAAQLFAVKTIRLETLVDLEDWHVLEAELEVMLRVNDPNIIEVSDIYETASCVHIVLPFMGGGNLASLSMTEMEAVHATRQILSGMQFLQKLGVVHRDIKPDNVVMDSFTGNLKIIDFGLSAFWKPGDNKLRLSCGTPGYMSPEMRTGKGYTCKTDMWSLGILVFKLLVGEMPFSVDPESVPPSQEQIREEIESLTELGLAARHFLSCLLNSDPSQRPTAAEALQHPWLIGDSLANDVSNLAHWKQPADCYKPAHPVRTRWADLCDEDEVFSKDAGLSACSTVEPVARPRWADLFDDEEDDFISNHWENSMQNTGEAPASECCVDSDEDQN
jgi:serine/threonine protein kinase